MKAKYLEHNKKKFQEKFNQITKVARIHNNLSKLDNFVRNQLRKSSNESKSAKNSRSRSKERQKTQE